MRDEKTGDAKPALQALDLRAHGNAKLRIQVRKRFIKQEQLGFPHNGAPHGNALALTARKLPRAPIKQFGKAEQFGGLANTALDIVLGKAANAQPIGHIVEDAHMRIKRVILKHHGDIARGRLKRRHVPIINQHRATRAAFQPRHDAQQG